VWEFVAFGMGQVIGDLRGHVVDLPAAGCRCHGFGEVGDPVAEGVGRVVIRQRALLSGPLQDAVGVVTGLVEGGQLHRQAGQSRVSGEGRDRLDDVWGPFPDAGFGDLEPRVEVALGLVFCWCPADGSGGSEVGVGDGVGGAPESDVVDQGGVEVGQVACPAGCLVGDGVVGFGWRVPR
jgi:hypothetical protein